MRKFNLKLALEEKLPVVLRNGQKAMLLCDVRDYVTDVPRNNVIKGFMLKDGSGISWSSDGNFSALFEQHPYDIVGMYIDSLRVDLNLPCPLKHCDDGDIVFYIYCNSVRKLTFSKDNIEHDRLLSSGSLFASEKDCTEWLMAMRESRR